MSDRNASDIDQLAKSLQPHYSNFNVANRLLFTGHSHQAWPDVAREGLNEAFLVSSREVDTKWETAFEKAEILRGYLREYYDDPDGCWCLGENTHLLLVSWLSSLDLRNKPKIITTDGEFHSMYRQLRRLQEEGVEIVMVDAESDDIANQIQLAADDYTAAIMLSRVYFESSLVNRHIPEIAEVARSKDIPFLIDDYHGTNVVPLSLREENLEDCFLLIGGYKYLQWGEGNCFLRFPCDCEFRPVVTGWFASFSTLDEPRGDQPVQYDDGDRRFATGTYDSASQFRAAKVVEFFKERGLTRDLLARQYRQQIAFLKDRFLEQQFDPSVIRLRNDRPIEQNGGFLALKAPKARAIQSILMKKGVFTDARGSILRIGPAPYIDTGQMEQCMRLLAESVSEIS